MCGQTSTDRITFIKNASEEKISGTTFQTFKYFSVIKTTELYDNTYFQYGAIIGLGYPNT